MQSIRLRALSSSAGGRLNVASRNGAISEILEEQMKKVYIAHPLRGKMGDVSTIYENYLRADALMLALSGEREKEDILFLSPVHAFSFVSPLGPQDWVLAQCRRMLELADELWVFGNWRESKGCQMEIEHARKIGVTVIFQGGEAAAQ